MFHSDNIAKYRVFNPTWQCVAGSGFMACQIEYKASTRGTIQYNYDIVLD